SQVLAEDLFSAAHARRPNGGYARARARSKRIPRRWLKRPLLCTYDLRPFAGMTKKLIIAEKPSVAGDVARALGGFARKGDYYESERYVLSSAVGHLLELAVPDEYEVKRGKWSFKHLPVI